MWMRIPIHPNVIPFDRVVIDELESRIVGFTNQYFPGGTLEENQRRAFRFEWLQQLIQAVDDLNFKYAIAHQDIAPRNLVVDDLTDNIKLFDFNFAARINCHEPEEEEYWREDRNDVKGVMFTAYEMITQDYTLRDMPHEQQTVENMPAEWKRHPDVELNRPVETFQQFLRDWREQRPAFVASPEAINWPARPRLPPKTLRSRSPNGGTASLVVENWFENRQEVRAKGGKVLNWERPPSRCLDEKTRVLSTGKILK